MTSKGYKFESPERQSVGVVPDSAIQYISPSVAIAEAAQHQAEERALAKKKYENKRRESMKPNESALPKPGELWEETKRDMFDKAVREAWIRLSYWNFADRSVRRSKQRLKKFFVKLPEHRLE